MRRQWKQRLAAVLSASMVLSAVNVGAFYASEDDTAEIIAGFEELEAAYAVQELPIGAEETEIEFPTELVVNLALTEAEEVTDDAAVDGEEEDVTADESDAAEKATDSDADEKVETASESNADVETASDSNAEEVSDSEAEEEEELDYAFDIDLENDLGYDLVVRTEIQDIEWVLNEEESSESEFQSETAGTYVYEPVIPSEYKMMADVDLPQIEVRVGRKLMRAAAETGLVDGVLTIANMDAASELVPGTTKNAWAWKSSILNLNSGFGNCNRIEFGNVIDTATIRLNKTGFSLEPEDTNPAIYMNGNLTITSTLGSETTLSMKGNIDADNIKIAGDATVILDGTAKNGNALISVAAGNVLELTKGGAIVGAKPENTNENNGQLVGTNGSSIYLTAGAKVVGMSGVFSDQGKKFSVNTEVSVGAEDEAAVDNQLTEGSYVWSATDGMFVKGGSIVEDVVTGLKDGILTVVSDKPATGAAGENWNWNGSRLDLKFPENKKIVFTSGVAGTPEIKINARTVALKPVPGDLAISAPGDLKVTSVSVWDSGAVIPKLMVQGPVRAENLTVQGTVNLVLDGGNLDNKELLHIGTGNALTLVKGGPIEGAPTGNTNENNGQLTGENAASVYLEEGATVAGASGLFSDQGKKFNTDDEVVVVAADEPAADNQLTAGSYVWSGSAFAKGGGSAVEVFTGLKDGILTITKEKGGVKEEGWNWNGARLDLNDRFTGNKQIVFISGIDPLIKVNRSVVMEPVEGNPAITADGNLTITGGAELKLTTRGAIEANNVVINGSVHVETRAQGEKAALCARNGSVTIADSAAVTADGAMEAGTNIVIHGGTSVVVNADRMEPALYAKQGTITIGDAATVIVSNQSGAALNPAPDTSSYTSLRVAASEDASGKPSAEYHAEQIGSYKYLKIEKALSLNEIEHRVESLGSDAAAAIVDSLADQIRGLPAQDKADLKRETIDKMDQLLYETTNIDVVTNIEVPAGLGQNKQIQNAEICGALLAADITSANSDNARIELRVVQKQPEKGAALTFECDLYVNGNKVKLMVPVKVTIELPPEFYPVQGYKIHHVGDGIDEWMDFIYNGADNTTQFWTTSFSTFSIVNTSSSSGGGSGSGGSSGGGGGGGGGGSRSLSGASLPGKEVGRWILDATGWWYQYNNKSYPKDGWAKIRHAGQDEWYFFDKNGYMVTGWVFWNGNWYYMCTAPDTTNGKMLTGWQTIDGKLYYFSEAIDGTVGIKRTNIQIGEYFLGQDGVARKR
ncbi:MAG: hypothetical protein Q4F28_09720 [Eubacteriales bacterium]|nr:hypothetical protein [Eubacteriales bacterium]